jgi:hypothetical protein
MSVVQLLVCHLFLFNFFKEQRKIKEQKEIHDEIDILLKLS